MQTDYQIIKDENVHKYSAITVPTNTYQNKLAQNAKQAHYNMNQYNTKIPSTEFAAIKQGYTKMTESQSSYHKITNSHQGNYANNNKKYIDSTGKKEAV